MYYIFLYMTINDLLKGNIDNLLVVSSKSVEFEILSDRPTILGHFKIWFIENPQHRNF